MKENKNNDKLDYRRYVRMIKSGKWLYAICLAIALPLAVFYAIVGQPVYRNYADMMLEEEQFGNSGGGLQSLLSGAASLTGLFSISGLGHQSIDDEQEILSSHECYVRTSRMLELNRLYTERDGVNKKLLHKTSPIRVEAPSEYFDTLSQALKLKVELEGDGKVTARLYNGFMGLFKVTEAEHQTLPFTLHSPTGDLLLLKTDKYTDEKGRTITVQINGNQRVALSFEKGLKVEPVNKKANALRLSMKHANKQFAYDVMSTHVASYRAMHTEHKSEVSIRQIDFLDDRIGLLMNELDTVETGMKNFMKGKNILDVENQAKLLLMRDETLKDSILVIETRVQLYNLIADMLKENVQEFPPLPSVGKDGLVSAWNELVVQRTQLMQSAKGENKALEMNREQLELMRGVLLDNIRMSNEQNALLLNRMKSVQRQSAGEIGQMPSAGLEYLNRERDLQVKNGLLLFLLQQRENAMMTMMSRTQTGYFYDEPYSLKEKDYTKKIIVAALLILLALCGPTCLLWLIMSCKDKLQDDSDLPNGWRENGRSNLNDLRRLIMSDPDVKRLYMQSLQGGESLQIAFEDCLQKVDANYELLHENDLERLMQVSDIKLNDSSRMVLFVPANVMKRSEFKELVKNVDPTYCYVLCQEA